MERLLLTIAETARFLGASQKWVRRNAERLGGVRLGEAESGTAAILRFDPQEIVERARAVREEPER